LVFCGFAVETEAFKEKTPMLPAYQPPVFSDQDRVLFDLLVPSDHWTRRADENIDFLGLRQSTGSLSNVERLAARVEHLRDILAWVRDIQPPEASSTSEEWQRLRDGVATAQQVLRCQYDS
jgi:hypothetical protein